MVPSPSIRPNERKRQRIEIDILAARKSLKFLKLCNEHEIITAKWFQKNVAQFESLETLILEYCGAVKNERLTRLELKNCNALVRVDVVVPGLESFQYKGRLFYTEPCCEISLSCC